MLRYLPESMQFLVVNGKDLARVRTWIAKIAPDTRHRRRGAAVRVRDEAARRARVPAVPRRPHRHDAAAVGHQLHEPAQPVLPVELAAHAGHVERLRPVDGRPRRHRAAVRRRARHRRDGTGDRPRRLLPRAGPGVRDRDLSRSSRSASPRCRWSRCSPSSSSAASASSAASRRSTRWRRRSIRRRSARPASAGASASAARARSSVRSWPVA